MTDTTDRESVERLQKLLSYGLPPHVSIQTGDGTNAPAAVFADADYEVGDGVCGLHASGKQANEPCIPYVRADALMHALAAKEKAEAERDALKHYLIRMDDELLARDGSAELSHDEAKQALRDVYLIACGEAPEFHPDRLRGCDTGRKVSEVKDHDCMHDAYDSDY